MYYHVCVYVKCTLCLCCCFLFCVRSTKSIEVWLDEYLYSVSAPGTLVAYSKYFFFSFFLFSLKEMTKSFAYVHSRIPFFFLLHLLIHLLESFIPMEYLTIFMMISMIFIRFMDIFIWCENINVHPLKESEWVERCEGGGEESHRHTHTHTLQLQYHYLSHVFPQSRVFFRSSLYICLCVFCFVFFSLVVVVLLFSNVIWRMLVQEPLFSISSRLVIIEWGAIYWWLCKITCYFSLQLVSTLTRSLDLSACRFLFLRICIIIIIVIIIWEYSIVHFAMLYEGRLNTVPGYVQVHV